MPSDATFILQFDKVAGVSPNARLVVFSTKTNSVVGNRITIPQQKQYFSESASKVIIFGAIDGAIGTALVGGVMGTAIGSMARVIQLVALLFSVILLATAQFGYGGWGGGFGMGSVVGAIDGAMIGAADGAMVGSMFVKK
ncbi:hypothetical protein RB195_014725 [Necator americanus]|uniref:Uncharacterized protein n=1 Tax=Necator americanus TaxID=51031 RepID=A0ABR1E1C6_NECAM